MDGPFSGWSLDQFKDFMGKILSPNGEFIIKPTIRDKWRTDLPWGVIKTYINSAFSNYRWSKPSPSTIYTITVEDRIGGVFYVVQLDTADLDQAAAVEDFEDNYKDNVYPEETLDGRKIRHSSPRPLQTTTYFTGAGDDVSDPTVVGGGVAFDISHTTGTTEETVVVDFNVMENKTYLLSGICEHTGMQKDILNFSIIPKLTTTSAGTGYKLYNNYLIVPSTFPLGDAIAIADEDRVLIGVPQKHDGGWPAAYWNADWNPTTRAFENIAGAPAGDGRYNMFSVEVPLFRFVRDRKLMSGSDPKETHFKCYDAQELGANMRLRLGVTPSGDGDHAFGLIASLNMYRIKTV